MDEILVETSAMLGYNKILTFLIDDIVIVDLSYDYIHVRSIPTELIN